MKHLRPNPPRISPIHLLFTLLVLLHTLIFLFFWLTNAFFYAATNDFLSDMLGMRLDYIRLCLGWATLTAAWSAACLLVQRFRHLNWVFLLLGGLFLLFFYGSFWMLFRESPVQGLRFQHLLAYFRMFLDILALAGLVVGLAAWLRHAERSRLHLVAVFLVYVFVWLLPLFMPPGNVYASNLPLKPRVIAHRGASMLAPENTLAAMWLGASLGAYGLESDLRLSADRSLFLMHDDTLGRTTDVADVFPGREAEPAENFHLAEVQQLNAGKWYVTQDPFEAIARREVNLEQVADFQNQRVPMLAEMLEVVQQSGTIFIFDLKQPTLSQVSPEEFFSLALTEIRAFGIDSQIWFLVTPLQAQTVQAQAPGMKRVLGMDYRHPVAPSELLAEGYQIVNAEYGLSPDWIKHYRSAGLWVNLYTVDEPWQFSRLWLLGVDSITTSNAGAMLALASPFLAISYSSFLFLWCLLGICGLVITFRRNIFLPGRSI